MRLDRCSRLDIKRRRPSGSAFFFARILAGQPADTVITDKACDAQEWLADPFRLKSLLLEVKSRFESLFEIRKANSRFCFLGFLAVAVRLICQDGARNNAKDMIGPWRKRGLIAKPAERRHQGKQVFPSHIGAGRSIGLGTKQ